MSEQTPRSCAVLLKSAAVSVLEHAREAYPEECCGLIGSVDGNTGCTVYRLRNVSGNPVVAYDVAPEELFLAQRQMRERGESLFAIYHSHPQSPDPVPSQTDIRRAFYPEAVYLIAGGVSKNPKLRAFEIRESESSWRELALELSGDDGC